MKHEMNKQRLEKRYEEKMIDFSETIRYSDLVSVAFSKIATKFGIHFDVFETTWDRALYIYPWMSDKENAYYKKENNAVNLFEDSFEVDMKFKKSEELYNALDGFYLLTKELNDRGEGIKKRLNQVSSWKKYHELVNNESMLNLNRPSLLSLLKSEFKHGESYSEKNFKLHLENFNKKVSESIEKYFSNSSERAEKKYSPLREKIIEKEEKAQIWWDNYQRKRIDDYINTLGKRRNKK